MFYSVKWIVDRIFHAIFIHCFFKLLLTEISLFIAYNLSLIQFYDMPLSELFHGRYINSFRSFLFMKLQYSPLSQIVSISSAKRNIHSNEEINIRNRNIVVFKINIIFSFFLFVFYTILHCNH